MIPKYTIQYSLSARNGGESHYSTDDPVACEEFLTEILDKGVYLKGIKHEGVELPRNESDRLLKSAAAMMAAKRLCNSLHIKPEEEHYRFGFGC